MPRKLWLVPTSFAVCALAVWLGQRAQGEKPLPPWQEAVPRVWRSTDLPHGYALVQDGHALLFDAPHSAEALTKLANVAQIDQVLLTHHHSDTCAHVEFFLAAKVPVRAPRASAPWLTPAGVKQFWKE